MILAASTPWIFFLDRAWWAWNGWIAIAGVAQIVAASAVLATLWFFWQQLKDVRERARKDFELVHTPLLSIQVTGKQSQPARLLVVLRLSADGQGPAYNVIVNMFDASSSRQIRGEPVTFPYVRAPDDRQVTLKWPDPEMMSWPNDPSKARQVTAEVVFTNIFNQTIRFQHTGYLDSYRGLRLQDAPTYLDLVGRKVRLGTSSCNSSPRS